MSPRKIMVKFLDAGHAADSALRVVKDLGKQAVTSVKPLFPGETEPELASLYEVDLAPKASMQVVLDRLRSDVRVEYAHAPQQRKTM